MSLVLFHQPPPSRKTTLIDTCCSAGQSKTVTLNINVQDLGLWSRDNHWIVEPGTFTIKVGTSDQTFQSTTLTVS